MYFNVCWVEFVRAFRFDFSYTISRKEHFFYETQGLTLLIYRVLDIPTLYLDNIIGHGVVL